MPASGIRRAALATSLVALALQAIPARDPDRLDVERHVEEKFKQARAFAHAAARNAGRSAAPLSQGSELPITVEGRLNGVDVLTYDLSFSLDPAARYLEGRTVIRLSGVWAETSELALDFDESYTVSSVIRDETPIQPASFQGGRLTLTLDPPLRKEERTTLTILYGGAPPSYGALQFWRHGNDWAATSVAEPFGARTFWPCVDDPSDRAVVTVRVTVPAGYVSASAGLASQETLPDGRNLTVWRLPEPISTYLVSLNVANYVTIEDRYVSRDGLTEMPIRSYVLPEHRDGNVSRLAALQDHLAVQASWFGEYPFLKTKYGIVEASFGGGMEHPTMTSIGTAQLGGVNNLTSLLVHELTHQWWGDNVTMRTWDDLWLNEGFATYGEVLYAEKSIGQAPGALLATRYDDGRYAGALAQPVVASASDPFRFTGSVYRKGAYALHMLRRLVGDDTFFGALRTYGAQYSLGNASRADLRRVFEEASGLDLKYFFDQWLETPYRPTLRASYQNNLDFSRLAVVLEQTQTHDVIHPEPRTGDLPTYRLEVPFRARLSDGSTLDGVLPISGRSQAFSVPIPARKAVVSFTLDPDGDLLKVVEAITGS